LPTPTASATRYAHDEKAFVLTVTDGLEAAIQFEGPETVAAAFRRAGAGHGRMRHAAGGYRGRDLRQVRRAAVSDEVICVRPAQPHLRR
jgi:hypothetical protein